MGQKQSKVKHTIYKLDKKIIIYHLNQKRLTKKFKMYNKRE